jgi:hypothetical protein
MLDEPENQFSFTRAALSTSGPAKTEFLSINKAILLVGMGALWMSLGAPLRAQTAIFDNSVYDLKNRFNPGTSQVGDEITLAGTARYLQTFTFEYWGTNTAKPDNSSFSQPITATVMFYRNNGTPFNGYPTPANSFFTETFSVGAPTSRSVFIFTAGSDFPAGGLFIPTSDMTWSVQFSGMGSTDSVGVDLYSPPVVGGDFPDYWQNIGTVSSPNWLLLMNTVPVDFGAQMYATVSEPSTVTIWILGGLGILTRSGGLRSKE